MVDTSTKTIKKLFLYFNKLGICFLNKFHPRKGKGKKTNKITKNQEFISNPLEKSQI